VVFGSGPADADLVLVGEAPGRQEDLAGEPLLGRPRRTLDELLREAGIDPAGVFVTNALLCRPPDNRDPSPAELDRCREHLLRQLELVAPRVVCTLGTLPTRVLRGAPEPVLRVHGRPEVVELGTLAVRLLPLLHPAAALYRPQTLELLRRDLAQLPALLALPRPGPPEPVAVPPPGPLPPAGPDPEGDDPAGAQLGLF
jgi:uracil-DNA glycosylase